VAPWTVAAFALGALAFVPSAYASVTVPMAPTDVAAAPGNASAIIKWVAPTNDGGSAIIGYTATSSPGSKTCATTGAKTCTIRGLANGTSYTVTVKARNKKGMSQASAHANVKPGVPLAPTGVRATAGNAQVTVSWTAPANNGSIISKYMVTSTPGSKSCTKSSTTCTVTGLTNGTPYKFRVSATNSRGTGAASVFSSTVTPHLPPTLTITASNGTQTYGGSVPTISAQYSGFVNGDSPASLTAAPSCISGTTSSSPVVGTYVSSCSGAVDSNYTIIYVGGSTTVTPATLTITANPETKMFGQVDPVFTFVAVGLVGTDSTTGSLSRAPGQLPGIYSITLGTLAAGPNYKIVYTGNTLTITPDD
jgi:MBG domain (YGX type)/Fibronectin type III domain